MKHLLIILCLFLIGCNNPNYTGTIATPTGQYTVTTNRPMLLSVIDANGITVESDSRTKGLVESLGVELGYHKSEYNPFDAGY